MAKTNMEQEFPGQRHEQSCAGHTSRETTTTNQEETHTQIEPEHHSNSSIRGTEMAQNGTAYEGTNRKQKEDELGRELQKSIIRGT